MIDGRAGSTFAPEPAAVETKDSKPAEEESSDDAGQADDGEETTDVYYKEE